MGFRIFARQHLRNHCSSLLYSTTPPKSLLELSFFDFKIAILIRTYHVRQQTPKSLLELSFLAFKIAILLRTCHVRQQTLLELSFFAFENAKLVRTYYVRQHRRRKAPYADLVYIYIYIYMRCFPFPVSLWGALFLSSWSHFGMRCFLWSHSLGNAFTEIKMRAPRAF